MPAETSSATIGSIHCTPLIPTETTPANTPSVVSTSVYRWRALASSVGDPCCRPARISTIATTG
jgi:hypothetical protein